MKYFIEGWVYIQQSFSSWKELLGLSTEKMLDNAFALDMYRVVFWSLLNHQDIF